MKKVLIFFKRNPFLLFFIILFLIRFPFFFRDYIDRDESTFILMGQAWVNGHLPYTYLWDLKPPITFAFFALVISLFGKSILVIRLIGTLLIAFTALGVFKIANRLYNYKTGIWAGILYALLSSLWDAKQGVMSEHICIFFIVWGWVLIFQNKKYLFLGSVLFGFAIMTKLNVAYLFAFLGFGMVYYWWGKSKSIFLIVKNSILYNLGILLIFSLLMLFYFYNNELETFWNSVILASLNYSSASSIKFNIAIVLLLILLVCLFISYGIFKKINQKQIRLEIICLCFALAGLLYSFLSVGIINGHYLILLFPFVILLLVGIFWTLKISKLLKTIFVVLLVIASSIEPILEYSNIRNNYLKLGTFYNGEAFEVADYLSKNYPNSKNLFFTEFHIGYWLLDSNPPTKVVTHPSNLMRDYNYKLMGTNKTNSLNELEYILSVKQPKFIITKNGTLNFCDSKDPVNQYFLNQIKLHYKQEIQIDKAVVFKRIQ